MIEPLSNPHFAVPFVDKPVINAFDKVLVEGFDVGQLRELYKTLYTESERDALLSSFDKENSEIINELLVGLQFFSELDIARVNESLKTFVANLKWDGSFIMKLINIPFYKMDKASFTIKKEMLKEIQVTFEKYQDIPQEQMRLEVYD